MITVQSLPQAELFVRQRERPGLPSQALAWPPRLSAGRRESGSQRPWLGEAAPHPEGSSVCAQKAPARLGFPGALPQRRVVWMWFGAWDSNDPSCEASVVELGLPLWLSW